MTQVGWTDNQYEGVGLRKAFKKLQSKLETTEDVNELATLTRSMAYVAQAKSGLKDNEEIKKLQDEVGELKRIMGIAQRTQAVV